MRIAVRPQARIPVIVPSRNIAFGLRPPADWRRLALRRARSVRDLHYTFDIRIAASARSLRARQWIELTLQQLPQQGLWLDWRPEDRARWARSAPTLRCNGYRAALHGASLSRGYLYIPRTLLALGRNWIQIDWDAAILASSGALTCYHDPADGARYIYTLFVPADASSIFPCFDQPDLKARFSLSLRVPHGWQAVSNAPLTRCDVSDRTRDFIFAPTEPISTYVFAFAAGPFRALAANDDATHTRLWVRRSQARRARTQASEILSLNDDAVRYFTRYFGHSFPFAKYDLVLLPELPYRGMEHAGATFLNERATLLGAAAGSRERFERAQLIYHETAHQWLGDLVTMRSFDDLWIKEGFANFMAYKLAARGRFRTHAEVGFHLLKWSAYATDDSRSTRALHYRLPDAASAKLAYGTIVYGKAPALLRQWEDWLGATTFRAGVREFVRRHAYAAAGWRDLVAALRSAAGARIEAWARPWILQAGVPSVIAESRDTRSSRIITLRQTPLQSRLWPLQITVGEFGNASRKRRQILRLNGTARVLRVPYRARISFDPEDAVYSLFRIPIDDLLTLAGEVARLRRPLHRMQVWQALWQAVREARISPAVFVEQALVSLGDETHEQILQNVLQKAGIAMDCWLTPHPQSVLAAALDMLLWQHLNEARSFSVARCWLEGCIALSRGPAARESLRKIATGDMAIKRVRIDDGTRLRAAASAITRGAPIDPRAIALSRKVGTAKKQCALLLQAASPDPRIKRAVLHRILTDRGLPDEWIVECLPYLNHPAHAPATLPALPRALNAVPKLAAQRKIFFVNRWLDSALGGQNSDSALDHARTFVARDDIKRDVLRKVRESMDQLERTVRIRRRWPQG